MKNINLQNVKFLLTFFSFFLIEQSYAQLFSKPLEENVNWNKYQRVIEKKKNNWINQYLLKEGKVISFINFFNEDKRMNIDFVYDDKNNIAFEIVYFITNGATDTIALNNKYNTKNLLVEDLHAFYEYDNKSQLIKKYSKSYQTSNQTEGWLINYTYNLLGEISEIEKTNIKKGIKEIEIEQFTYDSCKNIKSIKRSSNPQKQYPIIIIGGDTKYEDEVYEYEYNSDCLWTKKYLVTNGNKELIAERELY